jgi:hypothetical protein
MAGRGSFISSFKPVLKLAAFAALLALPLVYFGDVYEAAAGKNRINEYTKKRFEDFYEAGPLDIVFVGSSHSYCAFDPEAFDARLGIKSFQLGTPLQQPSATLAALEEVFRVNAPSVVVMELYWGVMGEYNPEQAEALFPFINNRELERRYYAQTPPGARAARAVKTARFMNAFWTFKDAELEKYFEERGLPRPKASQPGTEYYRSKGYVFCDYVISEDELDRTNQFRGADGKNIDWSRGAERYVEKIKKLCDRNGARLVCVTAPVAPVSLGKIANYDKINERAVKLCGGLEISYTDYNAVNAAEGLVKQEHFRDDAHLNDSGAQIISGDFAARVLEGCFD